MRFILFILITLHVSAITVFAQDIAKEATGISPLLIGEKIPDIMLNDTAGKPVSLLNLAGQKQTILIFYRGGWCPYCNTHLAELQAIESDALKSGYQIIAISPDSPENLRASIDKHKLRYTLLSDSETKASQYFGLAFQAPEKYGDILAKASGNGNSGILLVPAVFVLNKHGEILFEYINPDFKKRLKGSLLLAVLNEVKE